MIEDCNISFPERSGKWRLIEKIGSGSYGTVFKVESLADGSICAVKIISIPDNSEEVDSLMQTLGNEKSVRDYFLDIVSSVNQEIKNLEVLKECENIVNIKGSYIKENPEEIRWDIFIFMEYLENFAVDMMPRMHSQEDVIRLGLDVCSALEACEKKGIIHRDLKPENILANEAGAFKLCDFGVAKRLEASMKTNSVKGTFSYMAPEVYHGKKSGCQADIYSLGLILYQMMNRNRLPFIDVNKQLVYFKDKEDAVSKRMSGQQMAPPADADSDLASIIMRACAYSADERYQSASELKEDLLLLKAGKYK